MNNLKTNPIGIDKAIERFQIPVYEELKKLNASIKGYGRVYINKRSSGYVLETYLEGTNDYVDVLNGEDSRFFFYLYDTLIGNSDLTVKVDFVCMVNLDDFFGTPERKDEEFRAIIVELFHRSSFNLKKIILGMQHIEMLSSGLIDRSNISFSDMHPFHAVTFQAEVNYKLKTC